MRQVVQSCDIARAGGRIQKRLNSMLKKMNLQVTKQENELFYWREDQNPTDYAGIRASGEDDSHRDVRDVPVQEVANAVCLVLHEQISMEKEDLYREAAKKLGYIRLGNNVQSALALGIQFAEQQGMNNIGNHGSFVLSDDGTARAKAVIALF